MRLPILRLKLAWKCFVLLAAVFSSLVAQAQPILWSVNGHYYEFVRFDASSLSNSWSDARAAAAVRRLGCLPGHLATITSAAENDFIATHFNTGAEAEGAWLGGVAAGDDGIWRWDVGPEAGTQFAFWKTPTPPYEFANWGGIEPNHAQPNEDYLVFNIGLSFAGIGTGQWWDAVAI